MNRIKKLRTIIIILSIVNLCVLLTIKLPILKYLFAVEIFTLLIIQAYLSKKTISKKNKDFLDKLLIGISTGLIGASIFEWYRLINEKELLNNLIPKSHVIIGILIGIFLVLINWIINQPNKKGN